MLSTGPYGTIIVTTKVGEYRVPERWADRRMPTLRELAQFCADKQHDAAFLAPLLHCMVLATSADQRKLIDVYPRIYQALEAWQSCTPLVPVEDAHGPTMRQLAERIAEGEKARHG